MTGSPFGTGDSSSGRISGTSVRHDQHGWAFEVGGVLFITFFHLLYSRRVDAPPPAHQTATMTRRQWRTGKGSGRYGGLYEPHSGVYARKTAVTFRCGSAAADHRAQPRGYSTATGLDGNVLFCCVFGLLD